MVFKRIGAHLSVSGSLSGGTRPDKPSPVPDRSTGRRAYTAATVACAGLTALATLCGCSSGEIGAAGDGQGSPANGLLATGAGSSSPAPDGPAAVPSAQTADASPGDRNIADASTETCLERNPGRAPLRRLTRVEYNRSVYDLVGDTTAPGDRLPAELLGNGFGNDADQQPVSSFLIEQYANLAAEVAARAAATEGALSRYAPCVAHAPTDADDECAREFITSFAPIAFRRPVTDAELSELRELEAKVRKSADGDLRQGLASVVEAAACGLQTMVR